MMRSPPTGPNPVPSTDGLVASYAAMFGVFALLVVVSHGDVFLPGAVGFLLGAAIAHAAGRTFDRR